MNYKSIKFEAVAPWVLEHTPKPVVAKSTLPDWYKNLIPFADLSKNNAITKPLATMKRCQPLLDMYSAGYILSTWSDIFIGKNQNGHSTYTFEGQIPVITEHDPQQIGSMPIPSEYETFVWKWTNLWSIQTPKGFSSLIIPPTSEVNPSFRILPAIVDTDSPLPPINFPFFLQKGFTGMIPKGTPMAQIIPIKRENWEAEYVILPEKESLSRFQTLASNLFNSYRIMFHKKKSYR